MNLRKSERIFLWIALVSFFLSIICYMIMPDMMTSHWNMRGEADGQMPKFYALFLTPLVLLILAGAFILVPKIDPLKANIESFRIYFDRFMMLLIGFMVIMQLYIISWNLGWHIKSTIIFPLLMGVLFYYVGVLCAKARRNYFIGIKTPWTLNSDTVWNKTHALAGRLYKISGIIAILGIFFPCCAIFIVVVPVVLASIYLILYSYLEFKKEEAQTKKSA